MKGKRIFSGLLCFLLILTVCIVPTVATAADGVSDTDYSKEGSYFNNVYTSGDVLRALGYDVSDAEYDYLKEYGGINFKYEEVTTQYVGVETYEGSTKVIAYPYSYVSRQGNTLTWTPVTASIGDEIVALVHSGDRYVADFGSIAVDDDTTVKVEYSLDKVFNVSKDDVNGILNLAYNNVGELKAVITTTKSEYDAKKEAYDAFCAEYPEEVSKYYSDLALYKQYTSDKLAYDERNALYQAYLTQRNQYEIDKTAYDKYLVDLEAYNTAYDNNVNYDANYAKYEQDLAKYNAFLNDRAVVKGQLEAFDAVMFDKVTSLDRQLYSAINSGLVDQVIEQKTVFMTLGADKNVIDNCEKSTGVLRGLLAEYKSLKTEKEKYDFYKQNYVELRDNIILLTQALENLYTVGTIAKVMMKTEKTDKFVIFVSQLILCSNILSDSTVYDFTGKKVLDTNTTISYYKHDSNPRVTEDIITILEGDEYAKATVQGTPLANGYPQEVAEPKPPVMMELPPEPVTVVRPVEPEVVDHPGAAPEVVAEPEPLRYANGDPVVEPDRPEILDNEIYKNLVSAYDEGMITERAEVSEGYSFTPTKTVVKKIKGTDVVTVTFTDARGNAIASVAVDKNTAANFTGEIPQKAEDFNATYTFSHWVDAEGNPYDLSNVETDVTLYPYFNSVFKEYAVEKNVNNSGLNYLIVEDTERALAYTEIGNLLSEAFDKSVGIIIYASNTTVKIENKDVKTMVAAGITAIDADIDLSNPKAYKFAISFKKGIADSDAQYTLDVSIPCSDEEFARMANITYTSEDGQILYANKSYKNGRVSFKARAGVDYVMCIRYAITLRQDFETGIDSDGKSVTASTDMAIPGDTVIFNIPQIPGVKVELYYYLNGTKLEIKEGSLVMPDSPVSVYAKFTRIVYTVTFMNGGQVVSTGKYYYGETIVMPGDPTKSSDGEFTYKFSGWSPEVNKTVTEDATYEAQYDATEVIDEEVKEQGRFWFIVLSIISAIIFLLTGVLFFFRLKRRKHCTTNPESACKETKERDSGSDDKDSSSEADTKDPDASNTVSDENTAVEPEPIYVDEFGGELLPNVDCDIKNEAEADFQADTTVAESVDTAPEKKVPNDFDQDTASDDYVPDVKDAERFLSIIDEVLANADNYANTLENETKSEAEITEEHFEVLVDDSPVAPVSNAEADVKIKDIESIDRDYDALYNTGFNKSLHTDASDIGDVTDDSNV